MRGFEKGGDQVQLWVRDWRRRAGLGQPAGTKVLGSDSQSSAQR